MPEADSSRIVVELTPRYAEALTQLIAGSVEEFTQLHHVAIALGIPELLAVLARYGWPETQPLIADHKLRDQVRNRRRIVHYNFFAIETSGIRPIRHRLLRELRYSIASAEFEPSYVSAGGQVQARWQFEQSYLEVIGANSVDEYGHGTGLAFIDHGWSLAHECFWHLGNRNDTDVAVGGPSSVYVARRTMECAWT